MLTKYTHRLMWEMLVTSCAEQHLTIVCFRFKEVKFKESSRFAPTYPTVVGSITAHAHVVTVGGKGGKTLMKGGKMGEQEGVCRCWRLAQCSYLSPVSCSLLCCDGAGAKATARAAWGRGPGAAPAGPVTPQKTPSLGWIQKESQQNLT